MPVFIIRIPVEKADGWQEWSVFAGDKKEALEAHLQGRSVFLGEQLEARELGEPTITEE